jgi:hypothetical protein
MTVERFAPGDRVMISPAHEAAPGWYGLVLDYAPGMGTGADIGPDRVQVLPERPEHGTARWVWAAYVALVRRAGEGS